MLTGADHYRIAQITVKSSSGQQVTRRDVDWMLAKISQLNDEVGQREHELKLLNIAAQGMAKNTGSR